MSAFTIPRSTGGNAKKYHRSERERLRGEGGRASDKQKSFCAKILGCSLDDSRIRRLSNAEATLLISGYKQARKLSRTHG